MNIDEMGSSSFDMCFIGEFHIVLIEVDMPLLLDSSDDLMFVDPAEDLPILALELEF
jgi:hypothetical protein